MKKFESGKILKIYNNYAELGKAALNPELFSLTQSLEESDFIFSSVHPSLLAKSPEELKIILNKQRNSFNAEFNFVRKDFLNMNIQKFWGAPSWWPLSFDMSNQLPEFAGEYMYRKYYSNENNLWLLKPSNLAHSSGMVLTDSLNLILKNAEHIKGVNENCIVSKYIDRCLTFRNCKFDMRWVIVIRSFEPLEVYVYKHFWVRVAKNDFTADKRR